MTSEALLHHVVDARYAHLFSAGGFDVYLTKHLLLLWIASALILAAGVLAARARVAAGVSGAPGLLSGAVEAMVTGLRDELLAPILGEDLARRHLPFFLTLTLLILASNLLGLVPSLPVASIPTNTDPQTGQALYLPIWEGATATGNFSIDLGLASIVFVYGLSVSFRRLGPWGYVKQWAPHGVPILLVPMLWVIEWAGMLIKHAVLAVRLTANMVAGHLVLFAILGMVLIFRTMIPNDAGWLLAGLGPILLALGIDLLELLVAFIQTGVFVILSAIFFGMTVVPHGGDHPEGAHH